MMDARILIVDDEEALAYSMQQALQAEFPGVLVELGYSGEEGLSRMAEANYDLIIADLRMPGFNGLELVKGVRYLDRQVPIVLVTGFGSETVRLEAERLGANWYLEKPFNIVDLVSAVKKCLSGREGTSA
jgi:DNA-binding response OmpR family regulator